MFLQLSFYITSTLPRAAASELRAFKTAKKQHQLQRPDKWEENKKETLSSEQMRISKKIKNKKDRNGNEGET